MSAGRFRGRGQLATMAVRDDGRRVRPTLSGVDRRGRTIVRRTATVIP